MKQRTRKIIKFAMLLTLPLVLAGVIGTKNWRYWHPPATPQDLQMRALMSSSDRVVAVVGKEDYMTRDGITKEIRTVAADFSPLEFGAVIKHFNFRKIRQKPDKGVNNTPSLYLRFYKARKLKAEIGVDYNLNTRAYASYVEASSRRKHFWLHPTTTFRVRQFVLRNGTLKSALRKNGANERDLVPDYAFISKEY